MFAMPYLKNALGGLGRSLTDIALESLQKPVRWWKIALYAAMFVLPGGSLAVLFFAWAERRRQRAVPAGEPCPARAGKTPACRAATPHARRSAGRNDE
jgi:hypothetical protein